MDLSASAASVTSSKSFKGLVIMAGRGSDSGAITGLPSARSISASSFAQRLGLSFLSHEFRNLQKRSINLKTRKNQGVHILSGYPCIKDIYKTFLQVSSLRYSGLALSEVSPSPLSHDTVSRWLKSRCFRPKDLWRLVEPSIDKKSPCVLIADDTLIAKTRSKK